MERPPSSTRSESSDKSTSSSSRNVYARLYDKSSYTGVYKKRFEDDPNDLSDNVVHNLSDTTRTNLKYSVDRKTKTPRQRSIKQQPSANNLTGKTVDQTEERATTAESTKPSGDPNDPHTLLKAVFQYYCRFGRTGAKGTSEKTLDNSNFSKFCRESPGLLGKRFSTTDVDLIFVKCKKKGERRINYARFLDALGMIATQKYPSMSLEESVPKLLESHISRLPCVAEFATGVTVQSVWAKRGDVEDDTSSNGTADLPDTPGREAEAASAPPAAPPTSTERPTPLTVE